MIQSIVQSIKITAYRSQQYQHDKPVWCS